VDPGHQHGEGERLAQVVVGAGVEPLRLVEVAVLGGEHEDRRPDAGPAQLGADPVAVAARQHDVEQDQVVAALAGPPEALGPSAATSTVKPSAVSPRRRAAASGGVVVHQQQLHRHPSRPETMISPDPDRS
jgi:hypothetical protein